MLYAMDRAKVTMVVHTLFAPLVLSGVGGAALDGARGATAGFALAYFIVAPLWWRQLRREAAKCESVLVAQADARPS